MRDMRPFEWDADGDGFKEEATAFQPGAEVEEEEWESGWEVREATYADLSAVAAGVSELLFELGGEPASSGRLEEAAQTLIDDSDAGLLLVAENEGQIVGVLGASWQVAIRIPGRYGIIQELWVHPAWRGLSIGNDLLMGLFEFARERDVLRLEVGLPGRHFANRAATEAFYVTQGFIPIGLRMRRLLDE